MSEELAKAIHRAGELISRQQREALESFVRFTRAVMWRDALPRELAPEMPWPYEDVRLAVKILAADGLDEHEVTGFLRGVAASGRDLRDSVVALEHALGLSH